MSEEEIINQDAENDPNSSNEKLPDEESSHDSILESADEDGSKELEEVETVSETEVGEEFVEEDLSTDELSGEPAATELNEGVKKYIDEALIDEDSIVEEAGQGEDLIQDDEDVQEEYSIPDEEVFDQEQETEERDQEKLPWWKRLIAPFQRKTEPQPEKEISPLEKPSAADTEEPVTTKVDIAESEEPALMPVQEIAAPVVGEPVVSIDEEIIPELKEEITTTEPPITEDHVRSLVQEEISRTQSDLSRLVQAEFAREQENRRRTTMETAQDLVELVNVSKAETLRLEIEALRDEESVILQDRERPLRERYEDIDFIRDRLEKLEHQATELEEETILRAAKAEQSLAELEGRGVVADFRSELDHQKAVVDNIPRMVNVEVNQRIASSRSKNYSGIGLWTILLGLLLISAVGVAGILLPRQTGPSPSFLVEMASMYQAGGETEEAIRVLDEAVAKGINDTETLGQVGEMYRNLKQYDKAIAELERVVEKNTQNEDFRFSLARSYGSAGKDQEAIDQYQTLIEINPANTTYYLEMGHRYRSLKNYDQSLAQYQKTLEINPDYWQGNLYQGEVYREQQRCDLAIAQYHKALETNPNLYMIQIFIGECYLQKNDPASSIEHFQAAMAIDPDRFDAYYYIGEALLAQGRFNQALEPYQQAIERNDKYTEAYVGLGKVYIALGDCPNAIRYFTQAILLDPKHIEAEEGINMCIEN